MLRHVDVVNEAAVPFELRNIQVDNRSCARMRVDCYERLLLVLIMRSTMAKFIFQVLQLGATGPCACSSAVLMVAPELR
eukprot:4808136-Amphidinium_carterae.1